MNLRFEYLYRDAGNFKQWGEVVFTNRDGVSPQDIKDTLSAVAIDGLYFYAHKVGLPDLHFEKHNSELDHDWHEVADFVPTKNFRRTPLSVMSKSLLNQ